MKKAIEKVKKAAQDHFDKVMLKTNGLPRKTSLFFKNPATGNLVCYVRAHQLHLINKKGIESGIKNPKSGRFVGLLRAMNLGLLQRVTT